MTSPALALSRSRSVRDVLLAGLAGAIAPYLVVLGWAALSSAVWRRGLRIALFVDPTPGWPAGYVTAGLLWSGAAGAFLGAGVARVLGGPGAARWGLWVALATGIVLSVARRDAQALRQPGVVLFIASSALGFRLRARR
jgi:hypothetical protein